MQCAKYIHSFFFIKTFSYKNVEAQNDRNLKIYFRTHLRLKLRKERLFQKQVESLCLVASSLFSCPAQLSSVSTYLPRSMSKHVTALSLSKARTTEGPLVSSLACTEHKQTFRPLSDNLMNHQRFLILRSFHRFAVRSSSAHEGKSIIFERFQCSLTETIQLN